MELQDDVGLHYGYFGIDFEDKKQKWLVDNVHIYGYPGCVYKNEKQIDAENYMYGDSGKWAKESDSENRLRYKIPTSAGQSGSPVYVKEGQYSYCAVGIHTNGDIPWNSGVLLSGRVKTTINLWLKKIHLEASLAR